MGYHLAGILLASVSGICLAGAIFSLLKPVLQRGPLYRRKLPSKGYGPDFLEAVTAAYEAAGDIRGMLLVLQGQWKKGVPGKRIPAALAYLETSRYRDYETTLYYLSDQTEECNKVLEEILGREIRKLKGLALKN